MTYEAFNKEKAIIDNRRLLKIPRNVISTLSHSFLLSPGSGDVSTRGLLTDFSDSRKYKLSALSS